MSVDVMAGREVPQATPAKVDVARSEGAEPVAGAARPDDVASPVSFGGMQQSGTGRDLGPDAVEAHTRVTSVRVTT